jgi:sensor histidine kinase YesM
VSLAGVVGGFGLVAWLLHIPLPKWLLSAQWVASMAVSTVVVSAILSVVFFSRARSARAESALQAEKLRAERIEREAALAHLRALQAQIEPHFLFNTLANVSSLIDADPALSKRMLERFIRFLRASLEATRGETTTLAAEGDLISAYLEVLQVRMGSRLKHSVDIAPDVASFAIPPMLIQPVIENAIRHGVEPRIEGGEVRLVAAHDGDGVRIEVRDTGVGFASSTRGGTGLTNLRDRLKLLHGERASVTIADNPGGGTIVTLRLPSGVPV